jgi:hypothetical protein
LYPFSQPVHTILLPINYLGKLTRKVQWNSIGLNGEMATTTRFLLAVPFNRGCGARDSLPVDPMKNRFHIEQNDLGDESVAQILRLPGVSFASVTALQLPSE